MVQSHPPRKATRRPGDYLSLCHRGGAFWWCSSADRLVCSSGDHSFPYPDDAGYPILPLGKGRVVYRIEDTRDLCLASLEVGGVKIISWVGEELEVSHDGSLVAYEEADPFSDRLIKVVSSRTGEERLNLPNGTRVLFGPRSDVVTVWTWQSVSEQQLGGTLWVGCRESGQVNGIEVKGATTPTVAVLEKGKVAVQGQDMAVRLYDSGNGRLLSQWECSQYLEGAAGGMLILGTHENLLIRCARTFRELGSVDRGVVFGVADQWLATHQQVEGGGGMVRFWSLPNGKLRYQQATEQDASLESRFCFSPDGNELVLLLQDGILLSWSLGQLKAGLSADGTESESGLTSRVVGVGKSVLGAVAQAARTVLFGEGKSPGLAAAGTNENWLKRPPRPYPVLPEFPDVARTPEESILWLRARLEALVQITPDKIPKYSSEAGPGPKADRIELTRLERLARVAEDGAPPYRWSYDDRRELLQASKNYFDYNRRDLEVQVQLFPLLELLTRGDFESRHLIYYSNPGVMEPFRQYLDDLPNPYRAAHEAKQNRKSQADPEGEVDGWIIAELDRLVGLTAEQKKCFRKRFVEGCARNLLGWRDWDFSSQAQRESFLKNLLRNDLVDPDLKLPPDLKRRLESVYKISLDLATCKRCGESMNPAGMKKRDICWGCWGN